MNLCRSRAHKREKYAFMFTRTYSAAEMLSNEFHRFYEIKLTANSCIALCSSRNAVSFSSAHTTKRFPSPGYASAIQIVRPRESKADTQPQLHPALLRLSARISESFTPSSAHLLLVQDSLRCSFAQFNLCAHFL